MGTSVVTAGLNAGLNWSSSCPLALTNLIDKSQLQFNQQFGSGDAPGTFVVDTQYSNQYSIALSSTLTLNLAALTQTVNGSTLTTTFGHILGLMIVNTTPTTGYAISVGPGASNGFAAPFGGTTPVVNCGPASMLLLSSLFDGWTVDSTHKNITITNLTSSGAVVINFAAIGTSM